MALIFKFDGTLFMSHTGHCCFWRSLVLQAIYLNIPEQTYFLLVFGLP
jgi:hypothetical protein